jgi:hypothetical protein
MKALLRIMCLTLLVTWVVPDVFAGPIKRRRPQFTKDYAGYIVLPGPYSIEGIGKGIIFFAAYNNVAGTYTDLFADYLTGDLKGGGAGIAELHIIPRRLFLDLTFQILEEAGLQSFRLRGMDTSGDDYVSVGMEDVVYTGGRLTLSFWERMFELYALGYDGSFKVASLKVPDASVAADTTDPAKDHFNLFGPGFTLDLTDDRIDPRRGIRFDTYLSWSLPGDDFSAEYRVLDTNLTGYVPVGKQSTWVLNYFRSGATVSRKGETDPSVIAGELGLDCSLIADPAGRAQCQSAVDLYINNMIAASRYGYATSLGGRSRLRSYPDERFNGAHAAFFGTEFRWYVTDEFTPFDLKMLRDIRTAVQLAFFYEVGTFSETSGGLWDRTRDSFGTGLRVVNASGLIYRLDYATGKEGASLTVIVNYPWEAF